MVTRATAPEGFRRLHADARALLADWRTPDAAQESLRRSYLSHLDARPEAMWRGGPAEHFTASTFVFDHDLQRVLLVLHKKAKLWLQVGGHFEEHDRTVAEAATREAVEESGLASLRALPQIVHLDHHQLAATFGRCRSHLDLRFAAVADEGATPVVSHESHEIAWWPVDALPEPTDPALLSALPRVRDRLADQTA
ncbi:NUDIX hydrolase [Leekyejoonella antrihumi]|uniref:NUDIX domain-containing protein n=1 Tax=Leekyejoonella antrihumi TaxID=1660198 RepID=A0A563DZ91_9MICO|nr:NUDIX domain-containing protein [Leekyejoonella antrihumi]TWP35311.1 NUDIX domain-containing protein [Leekyejoonella antrihumi]